MLCDCGETLWSFVLVAGRIDYRVCFYSRLNEQRLGSTSERFQETERTPLNLFSYHRTSAIVEPWFLTFSINILKRTCLSRMYEGRTN